MSDEAPGRAGKGKEKAPADKDANAQQENDGSLSSLSRLAKSASSLPSALFSGPAGTDGFSNLSSRGHGKGETSRISEGLSRVGEGSARGLSSVPGGGESLRPNQTQEH